MTAQTGVKVPAYNPEQAVQGLAEAIAHLAGDAELRSRLGEAGRNHVREIYDWNIKGKFFAQL